MGTTAILFDLDDTLVVDEAAVEAALLATCVELQDRYGLDPQSLALTVRHYARELWRAAPTLAYCRAIGISSAEGLWAHFLGNDPQLQALHAWAPTYRRDAWAKALAAHGIRDTHLAEHLAETFQAERRARHWTFPEVDAVLRALQSRYCLAVVTNGAPDLQREKLEGVGLVPYFAIITVSGEVGIGKPDPRIFAHTLARHLEERGAVVVNDWASTVCCQDRVLMAQRMRAAGLPWPRTWSLATLESLLAHPELGVSVPLPLVLKSHYSRRGDLVVKVDRVEQVQALAARWGQEPIIVQEFVSGDGWDIKVWVIDHQVWAARRRSALEAPAAAASFPVAPDDLPRAWAHLALEIGRLFDLRLYGVDLLLGAQGPVAVDVNAFPGFRGVPGASSALVALVEQLGRARRSGA